KRGMGMVRQTPTKLSNPSGQGGSGGKPKTRPSVRSAVERSQRKGKAVKTARALSPR
ncbi:MAG: hypothetical protein XU14_C0051G0017, partial [Armatimonadetes bacterium CSP1-3]